MRGVIPYIFWPWFFVSLGILMHRRVTTGTFKSTPKPEPMAPLSASDLRLPPLPDTVAAGSLDQAPAADEKTTADEPGEVAAEVMTTDVEPPTPEPETAGAVATAPAKPTVATNPDRPASMNLADAVAGISMPCDLAPLMGTGAMNPRKVAFFTTGFEPSTVGGRVADELERLGFEITSVDDRTIRADQGADSVQAKMRSITLDNPETMAEMHPSAPEGSLVLELQLL